MKTLQNFIRNKVLKDKWLQENKQLKDCKVSVQTMRKWTDQRLLLNKGSMDKWDRVQMIAISMRTWMKILKKSNQKKEKILRNQASRVMLSRKMMMMKMMSKIFKTQSKMNKVISTTKAKWVSKKSYTRDRSVRPSFLKYWLQTLKMLSLNFMCDKWTWSLVNSSLSFGSMMKLSRRSSKKLAWPLNRLSTTPENSLKQSQLI